MTLRNYSVNLRDAYGGKPPLAEIRSQLGCPILKLQHADTRFLNFRYGDYAMTHCAAAARRLGRTGMMAEINQPAMRHEYFGTSKRMPTVGT